MMRGHRQIIRARMDGLKPAAVFVDLVDVETPVTNRFDDPENRLSFGLYPNVEVTRDDMRRALDLRFLVNCLVHVHGKVMDDDFGRLVDKIAEKAAHVVACAGDELMEFKNGEWQAWTF